MEDVSIAEWIILGVLALVLIVLISLRVSISALDSRVQALRKALDQRAMEDVATDQSPQTESAFDQFLAEDPERLKLSKTDQFAAYREWRKVKGMNWSS